MVTKVETTNNSNSDATLRSRVQWVKQPEVLAVLNFSNIENLKSEELSKKSYETGYRSKPGILFFGSAQQPSSLAVKHVEPLNPTFKK